ncbi:dixin-A-like [Sinocyclocheilus anshuiensis]|uniref:dixin-A-like n=1 Tax=Sinocyclocheilus anshuiensis TaxID=1608454 RepID=UPI0007B9FC82|nr:PREDICTED: dixin-A-like [Sinocyclocheilus anshuiensis]
MIASLSKGNLLDVLHEGPNEQQLAAYVSWVNAQLRKKPGLKPVSDLRQDLRDGVVLAHLIEIVAGELLDGIHYVPRDDQERKQNVEKILQFVSSKRIRMPQTSARDIVEGNLKSAMRLILALAAHFKPSASASHRAGAGVGRSSTGSSANHRPHSTMAMAQNAAAALAAARQDASRPGRSVFHLRQEWSHGCSGEEDSENPCWSVRALVQQYEGQRGTFEEETGARSTCLSSSSPTHTPKDSVSLSDVKAGLLDTLSREKTIKSEDTVKLALCDQAIVSGHDGLAGGCTWEDKLCEQQEQLEREMQEARKMVSSLQALLLHGSLPEDEQEVSLSLGEGVENAEQQLVVIRSRLDQSMEESQELKRELLRFKQEARNLQGVKDALQQRMAVQESSVLQLKQELLRTSMAKDELAGQNACLQRELEHKESILKELMSHETEELPGSQNNGYSHPPVTASKPHHGAEELQLVRDALHSLRNSFGGHDPQHHTLDTLEQGVASLMDRLYDLETRHKHERRTRGKSPGHKASHSDRDSWPPTSKMVHSQSSPALNSSACTKVLYFTDRSLTPFMVNIPKRLGEVTLRDFKAAVDREGNYRYHFKALDPEFGTVKEEVFQDDAVVPGWEGKIVAWVEEDHGQRGYCTHLYSWYHICFSPF